MPVPIVQVQDRNAPHSQGVRKWELWLLVIFLLSLPLLNPWVRGDGVGYYAFARAPLIEHNLDFQRDYQSANAGFRDPRLDENGAPRSSSALLPDISTIISPLVPQCCGLHSCSQRTPPC